MAFGKKPLVATLLETKSSGSGSSSEVEDVSSEFSYLASGSRDKSVRLWDSTRGLCLMTFTAHENWVRSVVIHASGKYVISTSDDKSIRVFSIKDQRCLRTIPDAHSHFVTSVTSNSSNSVFITASVDKNICVWSCN